MVYNIPVIAVMLVWYSVVRLPSAFLVSTLSLIAPSDRSESLFRLIVTILSLSLLLSKMEAEHYTGL